jgi:hypothetical protein
MPKFRKKPVVIDAWRIPLDNDESTAETPVWVVDAVINRKVELIGKGGKAYINTLEGRMEAAPGDWLIMGVKGELYARKPDIFAQTYEPA